MNPGEIHLAMFPFGGTIGAKLRPVLVQTGPLESVPEVLTAYMTSVVPPNLLPTDILIDPKQSQHSSSGLKQVTLLRLHKLEAVSKPARSVSEGSPRLRFGLVNRVLKPPLATSHNGDIVRYLGQVSAATWSDAATKLKLLLNLP